MPRDKASFSTKMSRSLISIPSIHARIPGTVAQEQGTALIKCRSLVGALLIRRLLLGRPGVEVWKVVINKHLGFAPPSLD
jgi:hypothetical protein